MRRWVKLRLFWEPQFPEKLDAKITQWMMRFWHRSALLDAIMMVIGKWTPLVMLSLMFIASTGWLLPSAWHTTALTSTFVAIFAALLARGVNEPISRWAARPRPFEHSVGAPLIYHEEGKAFPSNHATGAFALAMGYSFLPGYHGILVGLAFLLALSRVYSGLHHASDVFAGALHGTAAAWFVWGLLSLFHRI